MSENNTKALKNIKKAISLLEKNKFTLYFFVVDSKNVPSGEIQYIYQLAKTLYDKKYDVKMIYQLENEYDQSELDELIKKEQPIDERRKFIGVGEWLGKEYMDIPHVNISKQEWKVGPSDFLFIPEVFPSLMKQTFQHKAPCKRIVVLHNYDYITEFIPFGDEWGSYGIRDVIATTKYQSELITKIFPYVKTQVLNPNISDIFRSPIKPKNLIVNIISKKTNDVNKIIKQFYWKYPMYKFVTFRDLRGYSKQQFSEYLQESAITIWIDSETPFGYSAIEAMKCDNIIIGKVPEHIPEWMGDDIGLYDNGIWVYDINSIPDVLSQVIGSWMQDEIPTVLTNNMKNIKERYTTTEYIENVEKLINHYIEDRKKEFEEIETLIKAKNEEE